MKNYFKECASKFSQIDKKETIRVISHLDTDGICSAAILTKAMIRERRKFSVSFTDYLSEEFLKILINEPYNYFIFLDLGTSQLKNIKKLFKEKTVFILDHHTTKVKSLDEKICHINPRLFGISGSKEISGAGVVYLFTKELNERNKDLAYFGIVGAIGDSQENNGFLGINKEILKDAVSSKKLRLEKGIRFFGADNKPLYKVLKNSVDIYIPGVTGYDDKAIDFLISNGIEPKQKGRWTRLIDLKEEEVERLINSIIKKKSSGEINKESQKNIDKDNSSSKDNASMNKSNIDKIKKTIYGDKYILAGADPEIKDIRELSTILNACAKLDKASNGLGLLLGDRKCFIRAIFTLKEYKREILNAIKWIESKKRTQKIIQGKGYMIINAESNLSPKILGIVSSMLSRNREYEEGSFLLALSRTRSNKTKISFRIVGNKSKISLAKLLEGIVEQFNGEYGGHHNAAGGIIDTRYEKQFIESTINTLSKMAMEEIIE